MEKNIKILAIETSCDETAAALIVNGEIRSNIVYSQLKLHQKTLGIVPEVASRAHVEKILKTFKSPGLFRSVDAIAVTVGPGLIGSLLVGVDTAKTLAYVFKKPVIPINHIEAHIYANFARKISKLPITNYQLPKFPVVALVVSGGHTSIILMRGHNNYKSLGRTLDDAAGEAFDKVAKILNLGYPGGPAIADAAAKAPITPPRLARESGEAGNYQLPITLPRPMIDSDDFNFSFSGLKTSVLYLIKKLGQKETKELCSQIAAEFQQAAVDVLVAKTIKAARKYQAKSIMLGGGVAANQLLRKEMARTIKKGLPDSLFLIPDSHLCTDNAAMVGLCAYYKYLADKKCLKHWSKIKIDLNPRL